MGDIFDIFNRFYDDCKLRNESSEEFRKAGAKEPEDAFEMLVMGYCRRTPTTKIRQERISRLRKGWVKSRRKKSYRPKYATLKMP